MDDNHFLVEWLAYHYFVLPLRHLIVAVDPRSSTSPDGILRTWQEHGGLDVQRWNDDDFMTGPEREEAVTRVKEYFGKDILDQPKLIVHRARQRLFYYKCMRHFKERDFGWVILIDTDEFLHVNYRTARALNLSAPPIDQPGSVMKFLQSELDRPGHNLTSPCVQIPRIRYGTKESTQSEVTKLVPKRGDVSSQEGGGEYSFNASAFQTLRWRKHAAFDNFRHNKISKTMIDLRRVDGETELKPVDSVHRPIRSLCGHRRMYVQSKDQVFAINHYLGTWEQYSFRNDSRTGKERSAVVS